MHRRCTARHTRNSAQREREREREREVQTQREKERERESEGERSVYRDFVCAKL